jgi:oxepin-CoA hydrolase / 3-oxo-5,6-dehydrosuberyl-CoA semialdehyde dehydrogenase
MSTEPGHRFVTPRPVTPRRYWEELELGQSSSVGPFTITPSSLDRFLALTWEYFPAHTSDAFLAPTPMRQRVVPGTLLQACAEAAWYAARGTLATSGESVAHYDYLAPVHVDVPYTATVRVVALAPLDARLGMAELVRQVRGPKGAIISVGRLRLRLLRRGDG